MGSLNKIFNVWGWLWDDWLLDYSLRKLWLWINCLFSYIISIITKSNSSNFIKFLILIYSLLNCIKRWLKVKTYCEEYWKQYWHGEGVRIYRQITYKGFCGWDAVDLLLILSLHLILVENWLTFNCRQLVFEQITHQVS